MSARIIKDERDRFILRLEKRIDKYRARNKRLEAKIKATPDTRFLKKKPDYYYSFSGYFIMQKFIYHNGMNRLHAQILIIMSYYQYMIRTDLTKWNFNNDLFKKVIEELIVMGYVMKLETAGHGYRTKFAYVLTQKGKDIEADYERFYHECMDGLNTKKGTTVSRFRFSDGADFRRDRIPKAERRAAQGGGSMKTGNRPKIELYRTVEGKNGQAEL